MPGIINAEIRPLPLRARPYADETLLSFIVRLAALNRHQSTQWIAQDAVVPIPAVQAGSQNLTRLAALSGLNQRDLTALAYRGVGETQCVLGHLVVPSRLVTLRRRRFCPLCLNAAVYHRALWDLKPVTACPSHGLKLQASCPCGHTTSWTAPNLTKCWCGRDIRDGPAVLAPDPVVALSAEIARLSGYANESSTLSKAFRATPLVALLDLFSFIGEYDPDIALEETRRRPDPEEYIAAGYIRCRNWPRSFRRFLRDLAESPSRLARVRWPYKTLKGFRQDVATLLPSPAARAIELEARRFLRP